ncbi:PREDICTED: SWI/SNF-related matrix-associated actin-dependent regulator of chromatin subfamily A-like protein 1 [Dufourea novaeangliae]|uniref:SWI/SNF-related matrix-associated actin-dependent regulator of chromatin subfamily A-like protein 1 n=1 Tax=Dufourea novaeangliae TaxID=178035 RepID=A0A154PCX8_DUFNO|nr:PREDICTED: SWI/SNF-related matrix-associated actin-dependent regulator of chromatin subfamily A-like protein 1 [Dufourea novaeangliae]KZC09702.1 SWI/SNF-related matrix-associated actin-dependent regulator of chromatin subfamily A-like protein 1 [Dufourea novaeangliae]
MNYSSEEIERKRLLALQRKQQAQIKSNSPNIIKTGITIPSIIGNENKSSNTAKSPWHNRNRFGEFAAKSGNNSFKSNRKFAKQKERFNPIETKSFFGQKTCMTGKCYMISDDRFVLETSSYIPPLIEVLKTISSRVYDMKTKTWSFLLKDYESLMTKLTNFKSDVQIMGLPKTVLEIFKRNNTSDKVAADIDLSKIDQQLLNQLMPFQREGVSYGVSKGGRCFIADDMGLGKTIQALGIAHYFMEDWPLLIVTPSSVRYQWAEAIYTFLPSVPIHYVHQFLTIKDFCKDSKIVITTYDLLVRAVDTFERRTFGCVILDESHALKSGKTARHKAAERIVFQAGHVILLSGTPALSRPIELYSQINLIMPNFMRYQDYGIRYCNGEKTSFGWDFTGSSNMQELQLLLKHTCVIRRLKTDVLNELPTKKREIIVLDPDLIKVGTKEMEEVSKKLEKTNLRGTERHNTLIQYYNETSFAKQKAVCDYVSKLFRNKQKCLIFAHHQIILDAICETAESMDTKYIRIDGKTNPERRKYQIDKFQKHDDYLAAILSITAANSGITLTAAQLVVFAELFWNPGVLCQAEDRVHRIGQDDNVVIQYLIAKRTADDYLWPLIQRKMNVLNEVGLDQDFSLQDITVTKQALHSKQKILNYITNSDKFQSRANKEIVKETEINKSTNNVSETNCATEEMKELLELNEEDLNFCDWDEMA